MNGSGPTFLRASGNAVKPFRRSRSCRIATALLALLASVAPVSGQIAVDTTVAAIVPADPVFAPAVERGREIVDSLVAELEFPGMGVALAVDGQVIWAEGRGMADIARELPVDRHSVFPIYSVSKGLTGLALARFHEQDRIDLDAPVQRYVPSFPEKEQGVVTPRLLAGHLAGIRHYRPGAGEGTALRRCETAEEGIRFFADDPLVHAPGTDFHYTSYGFVLLSAAIASAAGQPFADVMAAEVFGPLGMRSTGLGDLGPHVPNAVSLYESRDALGVVPARRMYVMCKMGAGAFHSTASDLAGAASAMFSGEYVSDETLDILFTPMRNAAGEPIIEGLGWDVGRAEDGLRWVRRVGGNVDGWSALMAYPERQVAVALLANMEGADWIHDDADRVARAFLEVLEGEASANRTPGPARLVLTDARVVDVEEGRVLPNRALVIEDGRIVSVGAEDGLAPSDAAVALDLDGRYVAPGLADMHVHVDAGATPLLLTNGVTTVRVMMGTEDALAWKAAAEDAPGAALRVWVTGPLLAGDPVPWPHELIETPEAGRASVVRQADAGYDFVKIYDGLPADAYAAIVDEARRHGLPLIGHIPIDVGVEEALAAGQRSIEHVEQIMYATYGRVMTLPFERLADAVRPFEGSDVFVTPTLAGQERIHRRGTPWHEALYARPEMRWADPSLADWWNTGRGDPPALEALERRRRFFLFQQELTVALHEAGVPLLAGTDAPYPLLVPGFSLHDELAALVETGLTPLDALRAATLNAGRFLELPLELGVVRPGALADLVIVDHDPLDDIRALRRPWAVVSRGVLLGRAALDALLERAAAP